METQYFMGIPLAFKQARLWPPLRPWLRKCRECGRGRVVYIAGFDLDVRNPEPARRGRHGAPGFLRGRSSPAHMVERDAEQAILSKLSEELTGSPYKLLSGTLEIELEWEGHTP